MAPALDSSRVLVVDDEPQIANALRSVLSMERYCVRTVEAARTALATFGEWRPELVITDVAMTEMDGIELCRRIRSTSNVPIIVVSAAAEERSKVTALDSGADDYIVRPFGTDELLARVRAALRRGTAVPAFPTPLDVGEFRVDFEARRLYMRSTEVRLTPKEFDLFVCLARRPNRVLTHRTLLVTVWGETAVDHYEYLRVFIGQLRKKLEAEPSNPQCLVTEPWVGYRFNPHGMARSGTSWSPA